jgi:aspartyl-tRNA(Asn)/glutamyl-tRNA(Gln) amidotransferase subunit C
MELSDLEALAKIALEPGERDRFRLQLESIIGFVRKLQEVEAGEVAGGGAVQVSGSGTVRDDPSECLDREEVLCQAPDREGPFFRVPAVIDREGGEVS